MRNIFLALMTIEIKKKTTTTPQNRKTKMKQKILQPRTMRELLLTALFFFLTVAGLGDLASKESAYLMK